MLLEVTETAAEEGKRRLDLHTWGGNLKAMPLYKKVGWNWVPKTRVLMENYIPGIISCELFSSFFKRYYWYDALERELSQDPDDTKENGIGIYRYRFSGENGDELKVVIDREAKGICGFSLTLDGKTISAMLKPERHEGYIGFGATEFTLKVKNISKSVMNLSIEKKAIGPLCIEAQQRNRAAIDRGEEFNLAGSFILEDKARHLDRDKNPDEKLKTYCEFNLEIDGAGITLYSGIIPIQPVSLSTGPRYPCLVPGESKELTLILENCTDTPLEGIVQISPDEEAMVQSQRKSFDFESEGIATFEVEVIAQEDIRNKESKIFIEILVKDEDEYKTLRKENLVIPVLDASGALAYQALDNYYILETNSWRMRLHPTPPMEIREIENKITGHRITGWFYLPQLGYPFPDVGSEWSQKELGVKLENNQQSARIILSKDSEERPGLHYQAKYCATQDGLLQISLNLHNKGNSKYDNLGVRIGGWSNERGDKISVPLSKGLYQLVSPEWTGRGQIPKKPEYYEEEWAAVEVNNGNSLIGSVWSHEDIQSIQLARRPMVPTLEYKLDDLPPGVSVEKQLVSLVIGQGRWQKVRKVWSQTRSSCIDIHEKPPIREDIEVKFSNMNEGSFGPGQPILFLDKSSVNQVRIQLEIIHREPIEASGVLQLPGGITASEKEPIEFQTGNFSIEQPYLMELEISCKTDCESFCEGGRIDLSFPDRIVTIPFATIVYDSQANLNYGIESHSGTDLYLVESKDYELGVSPSYCASLVRFGRKGENVFYDTFPEANPFIWDDEHYSGMTPILQGWSIWDWQSAVPKEKWTIEKVQKGPWYGYEMRTLLEHCPEIEGIEVTISHLLLQGVPIVNSCMRIKNRSKKWNSIHYGFRGVPRLGEKAQSEIHTVIEGKRIAYKPTAVSTALRPDSEEGWGAFHNQETNQILGIISNNKSNRALSLSNGGEQVQWITLKDDARLNPGESKNVECFFVVAPSINMVNNLKDMRSNSSDRQHQRENL